MLIKPDSCNNNMADCQSDRNLHSSCKLNEEKPMKKTTQHTYTLRLPDYINAAAKDQLQTTTNNNSEKLEENLAELVSPTTRSQQL